MRGRRPSVSGRAVVVAGSLVAALVASTGAGLAGPAAVACGSTWTATTTTNPGTQTNAFGGVSAASSTDAWAAGGYLSGGAIRTLTERWDGTSWRYVKSPNEDSHDDAFNDVVEIGPNDAWAVGWSGFTLAEHWDGTAWTKVTTPNPGSRADALVAVDAAAANDVWAVGYSQDASGLRSTLIEHWDGSAWSVVGSPNVPGQGSGLADVRVVSANDVWAVGFTSSPLGYRTLAVHWDGTAWSIAPTPNAGAGNNVLLGLSGSVATNVWAVGYAISGSLYLSLTMHWDGTSWVIAASQSSGPVSVFRGAATLGGRDTWAAGISFDQTRNVYAPLAEHWNGAGWTTVPVDAGPSQADVMGMGAAPDGSQVWMVGSLGTTESATSLAMLLCPGSSQASSVRAPGATTVSDNTAPARRPIVRPAAVPRTRPAPRTAAVPVTAVDEAASAGIYEVTQSYGGAVGDFDNNGYPDLFVSHHRQTGRLWQNMGGQFSEVGPGTFGGVDQHHCAFADVNQDGLPDLFCVAGAERGIEVKRNALYVQQPDHTFVEATAAAGLLDTFGRGRQLTFLDVNRDGWPDVFVHNLPMRPDGVPGPSRLFINNGGVFQDAPSYGLDEETTAGGCVQAVDYDNDGWPDLLVCAGYKRGIRIYHNNEGANFTDVTTSLNINDTFGSDAELADVNGDGRVDLVRLSSGQVQVRMQSADGTFGKAVFKFTSLGAAARLGIGDVNGDGRPDIYVLQGQTSKGNPPDVMLINDGTGKSFTQMTIPETNEGCGDDVLPIDYDRNGLTDFVVLNGCNAKSGPVQLIAFFPTGSAPAVTPASAPTARRAAP